VSEDQRIREFSVQEKQSMLRKKLPKSQSPKLIWTVHQKGHMSKDHVVREFDVRENWSVLV
jgi:hypothetical protein